MDWRSFELLCAEIFRKVGHRVTDTGFGADEGIDLICEMPGTKFAIQCKRHKPPTGRSHVEAFPPAISKKNFQLGAFITTSDFGKRTLAKYSGNPSIMLINGKMILEGISEFPPEAQREWIAQFTLSDDWDVPTCPTHGKKMRIRRNRETSKPFWGCPEFPKQSCRRTFDEKRFPIASRHLEAAT